MFTDELGEAFLTVYQDSLSSVKPLVDWFSDPKNSQHMNN